MAKNNNNIIKDAVKHGRKLRKGGGGGGRSSNICGLWCDKNGKQRHIKTTALGIAHNQAFLLAVENEKIIFYTLSKKQEQQVTAQGVSVFKTAVRSKASGSYQSYASIEGVDDELYDAMVRVNGGANVRHGLDDFADEEHGIKWRDVYVVKQLEEQQ